MSPKSPQQAAPWSAAPSLHCPALHLGFRTKCEALYLPLLSVAGGLRSVRSPQGCVGSERRNQRLQVASRWILAQAWERLSGSERSAGIWEVEVPLWRPRKGQLALVGFTSPPLQQSPPQVIALLVIPLNSTRHSHWFRCVCSTGGVRRALYWAGLAEKSWHSCTWRTQARLDAGHGEQGPGQAACSQFDLSLSS